MHKFLLEILHTAEVYSSLKLCGLMIEDQLKLPAFFSANLCGYPVLRKPHKIMDRCTRVYDFTSIGLANGTADSRSSWPVVPGVFVCMYIIYTYMCAHIY